MVSLLSCIPSSPTRTTRTYLGFVALIKDHDAVKLGVSLTEPLCKLTKRNAPLYRASVTKVRGCCRGFTNATCVVRV